MKGVIILAVLITALVSCEPNRAAVNSNSVVNRVDYEPTYLKDRRLEEYSKLRTNSHGSSGPGNGGSYASGSYRQSAIDEKDDQSDNFAADTADEGRRW